MLVGGEICVLLENYAASSGNRLLMFRDNVPVPSSNVMKSRTQNADLISIAAEASNHGLVGGVNKRKNCGITLRHITVGRTSLDK
jgi:hypothetical protein